MIKNAETLHAINSSVGGKVFYACLEGYIRLSGDSHLTCTTSDDLEHSWTGSVMACDQYSEDSKCKVNLSTEYILLNHSVITKSSAKCLSNLKP